MMQLLISNYKQTFKLFKYWGRTFKSC